MKRIGILGSGAVGKMLGSGLIKEGYEVMLGTSDLSKLEQWKQVNNGQTGSMNDAAEFGEIIILAVKGTAAVDVLENLDIVNLKRKTIIDATIPIADTPPEDGVLSFFTNLDKSLIETLQEAIPEAHFVKAFNSVGSPRMVHPPFETKPTMFICGNNADAKREAREIVEKLGWEVEDMGTARAGRAIEPLCMLWCIPGFNDNQWTHAFKLLKKKGATKPLP